MAHQGLAALSALAEYRRGNSLSRYLPFGHPDTLCPDGKFWKAMHAEGKWGEWSNKPWQLEFHNAGKDNQERMLMAANRPGKTYSAAAEVAFHATGLYPDWWQGRKFGKEVLIWCGSVTNEASRDIVQKELLGGLGEELGTGLIPKHLISGKPQTRQAGIGGVVDKVQVRHAGGGISTIVFKSYDQGWRKWQGTAPDVVWLDEEPDANTLNESKIYSEALTRILSSRGLMMVTFTPLLGKTELVEHFMDGGSGVWLGTATWEDAPHLPREERERLLMSYPIHERETRAMGVPMMGEGRVFTVPESEVVIPPVQIPDHWARIAGIDFGIDHPASACWLAHDRDTDTVYLYDCYKTRGETAAYHAARLNGENASKRWIPVAWPHDGMNREKSGGIALAESYRSHGANLLRHSAHYRPRAGENPKLGGQPTEPIVNEMLERMLTGRFKVFSTCHEWLDEFRSYHRKDGKLVAVRDDALKASFYALMMLRYAKTNVQARTKRQASPYTQAVY